MTSTREREDVGQWHLLSDDVVYGRTRSGQREILFGAHRLSALERRLLMVVTGNTPLRSLLDLIDDRGDVGGSIQRLVSLGMIEIVPVH